MYLIFHQQIQFDQSKNDVIEVSKHKSIFRKKILHPRYILWKNLILKMFCNIIPYNYYGKYLYCKKRLSKKDIHAKREAEIQRFVAGIYHHGSATQNNLLTYCLYQDLKQTRHLHFSYNNIVFYLRKI